MKDKSILILIPMILLLALLISIIVYDNIKTNETNKALKKEKYECKQELKKLKKEKLNWQINK